MSTKVTNYLAPALLQEQDPAHSSSSCPGRSLHTLLYTTLETESGVLMRPSVLWLRLRREPAGRLLMRRLVYEALSAVARCHRDGITHRDLKPANLIVDLARSPALRLADFGSALDERTTEPRHGLYPRGPSLDEETAGYQPPEAALGGNAVDPDHPTSCVPSTTAEFLKLGETGVGITIYLSIYLST